jgi:hypothetical protein
MYVGRRFLEVVVRHRVQVVTFLFQESEAGIVRCTASLRSQ